MVQSISETLKFLFGRGVRNFGTTKENGGRALRLLPVRWSYMSVNITVPKYRVIKKDGLN